jgi:CBS domain-containing protein
MAVKVAHVMSKRVILAALDHSVGHVRDLLVRNRIHALPVVGLRRELRGIITAADLARRWKDETPVKRAMTANVLTVSAAADVSEAARIMRQNRIHHVVVVEGKQAVGMVSSFDLLKLIEDKVASDAGTGEATERVPG